jgi:ABC-type branched-subunit amino acid transport system substrate-binding protein
MYIVEPGLPPSSFGARAQALERKFGKARSEAGGAPVAGQAVEILLQAIARSDGTRASVTAHVLAAKVHAGILGDFAFDRNGDMSPAPLTIHRIAHGRDTTDRVIRVSSNLVR